MTKKQKGWLDRYQDGGNTYPWIQDNGIVQNFTEQSQTPEGQEYFKMMHDNQRAKQISGRVDYSDIDPITDVLLGAGIGKGLMKGMSKKSAMWYNKFHLGNLKNVVPSEGGEFIERGLSSEKAIQDFFNTGIIRNNKSAGLVTKNDERFGERVFWGSENKGNIPRNNYTIIAKNNPELLNRPTTYEDIQDILIKNKDNSFSSYPNWKDNVKKPELVDGGVIKDNNGYWNPDNWGHPVQIGSNNITMRGVNQPLMGISDIGDIQMMHPGQDYKFKGNKVNEYPIAQDGTTLSPKDFTMQLINSPKYRQRLSSQGYPDPNNTVKTRVNAVNNASVFYQDGLPNPDQIQNRMVNKVPYDREGSRYYPNSGAIIIDRKQVRQLGTTESGTEVHEYSHPETQPVNGWLGLNSNDRMQLSGRLKPEISNPSLNKDYNSHDATPDENKADMNTLRYQLHKSGVDVFNKDIDMRQLQQLKGSSTDFNVKRLFQNYEDKDLLWLLNNVASVQKTDNNNVVLQNYEDKDLLWLLNNVASVQKTDNNNVVLQNGGTVELDQEYNFTNYNKPTSGGWMDKYE